MTIKVYGISTYNGQRVTLALLEFGVEDFKLVKVDLAAKGNLKPEFLKIQSREPEVQRPRARYSGNTTKTLEEQALVNQWVETEGHQFNDMAFAPWSMEYYLAYKEKRPVKEKFFDIVEKQLVMTKYMVADFYSTADLNISPSLLRVMILQPALITTRKHVKAWYTDLTSRPMFKKMLEVDAGWKFPYGPFSSQETAQQQ